MKFEQYKMLKEHALAACAAAGAPFPATKEINPILLAYIGDVVFSMYVRLRLLPTSKHVRIVHDIGSKMVSAVCQCQAMQQLEAGLSEEESVISAAAVMLSRWCRKAPQCMNTVWQQLLKHFWAGCSLKNARSACKRLWIFPLILSANICRKITKNNTPLFVR